MERIERRDYRNFLPIEHRIPTPHGDLVIRAEAKAYGETHGRDVTGCHPETSLVRNICFEGPKGKAALSAYIPQETIVAADIYSASQPLDWGTSVDHENADMLVGPLHDPFTLASLTHELGHSEQHREAAFEKLGAWYAPHERPDGIITPGIISMIVEDAHYQLSAEEAQALEELKRLTLTIIRREQSFQLDDPMHINYYGHDRELDRLYETRHELLWSKLREAICSAHMKLEQDATDRAYRWLGAIGEQIGIPILDTPFPIPENDTWTSPHPAAVRAQMLGEDVTAMTLHRSLELALRSHSATRIPELT